MAGQKREAPLRARCPGHPRLHFACGLHKKDVDARHRRQVYAVCAIQTAMAVYDEEGAAVTSPKSVPRSHSVNNLIAPIMGPC
jgi:hypothetical protein